MTRPPAATGNLAAVVDLIAARVTARGEWSVGAAELRESLGVGPLEFYRSMYAAATAERSVLGLSDITGDYSSANPEVLLAALEVFCGAEAERRLAAAGVFFPHGSRVDILETFVGTVADRVAAHAFDRDGLSAMLRSFRRFETARAAYLATHFPVDRLTDEAVERYCGARRYDIPSLARANVRALIAFFFRRHVLQEAALFARLSETIYLFAVDAGFVERETAGSRPEPPDPVESARATLGVTGLAFSRALLRDRYRALMKRYHPDVNPSGLARAQEINAAYSLLLSTLLG